MVGGRSGGQAAADPPPTSSGVVRHVPSVRVIVLLLAAKVIGAAFVTADAVGGAERGSGSQVGASQDGAPYSGRESRVRSQP
jgi:hypothetical protein